MIFQNKYFWLTLSVGLLFFWQNCSKRIQEDEGLQPATSIAFSEEDEIWYHLETARIKVKQLEAIKDFSDLVSQEILDGVSTGQLAVALNEQANSLENQIKVQGLPSNSVEVIKSYTTLVDLLSQSRDLLLAYYMNKGFESSARNLDEARNELKTSIHLLESALDSLELSHLKLKNKVDETDLRLSATQKDFNQKLLVLEESLSSRLQNVKSELEKSMTQLNQEMLEKIVKNEISISENTGKIIDIDYRVREIESKLKPQIQYLVQLSEQTKRDLDEFTKVFEELRSSGSDAYYQHIQSWNCSEDLLEKQGQQLLNLPPSISEKCVISKEETLYNICVERYPTFCGACAGESMDQCDHWNNVQTGLTAKEKLDILMNIRQEIAIEFLAQQTTVHNNAIFGSPSCNQQCLHIEEGEIPSSCQVSDLNQCGIEGKLIALHINDTKIIDNVLLLNSDITQQINVVKDDFNKSREYSNQRFAELQSYVDQELRTLQATTEDRLFKVVNALSGIPNIRPSIKQEVDKLAAQSILADKKASTEKALIFSKLAKVPGFDHMSANEINQIFSLDTENILKTLSEGSIGKNGAIGSLSSTMVSLMRNTFETLAADQTKIPEYSDLLLAKTKDVCPNESILKSPFTNVVGRDPMEILAIGLARRVAFADGPEKVNNIKTLFELYQNPIVKGSTLQQAFAAVALDYRADVSIAVPQPCLQALDDYTLEVFNSDLTTKAAGQGEKIIIALGNADILSDVLALSQQLGMVMDKLRAIEETILSRSVIASHTPEYNALMVEISLQLVKASTSKIIAKIKNSELISLLAADENMTNGVFQAQFNHAIDVYLQEKNRLARTLDEAMLEIDLLKNKLIEQNKTNATLQNELRELGAAVGFLQAEQTKLKDQQSSTQQNLQNQIDKITDELNKIPVPDDFYPQILAVRHSFEGASNVCSVNQLSAMAFPTSNQFVGGYLTCHVNFRIYSGNGGNNVWGFGRNKVSGMWFKLWGSMTNVDVKVNVGGRDRMTSVDFVNLPTNTTLQQGPNKVHLATGSIKDGAFLLNVPDLFQDIQKHNSYFNQKIHFTPSNRFTGETGNSVIYTARFYSPLVLNFKQSESLQTLSINEGVTFDLLGNGRKQFTGWVSGSQGAFLVRDLNNNKIIDSAKEMFGEATPNPQGKKYKHGFEALAKLDSNKDNIINSKDRLFSDLQLWFDINNDGISQQKELVSLSKMNIQSISLTYKKVPAPHDRSSGNKVLYSAQFYGPLACGQRGCTVFDVFFNNIDLNKEPSTLAKSSN